MLLPWKPRGVSKLKGGGQDIVGKIAMTSGKKRKGGGKKERERERKERRKKRKKGKKGKERKEKEGKKKKKEKRDTKETEDEREERERGGKSLREEEWE